MKKRDLSDLVRLFESVNKITIPNKSILKEDADAFFSNLPPGFSQDDFMSAEEACASNYDTEEIAEDDEDDGRLSDLKFDPQSNVNKLLKSRTVSSLDAKIPQKKGEPMLHSSVVRRVVDENGNEIDPDKLRAEFSVRPKTILNQNEKLVKTGAVGGYNITMPKFKGLIHDETNQVLRIVNTCPHAGDCVFGCYAGKGGYAQYENSTLKSCRSLTFLFNDKNGWKNQLLTELRANKVKVLRWHDSGDFMSPKYLALAIDIAKETPEIDHYAYTKEVSLVKAAQLPDNFEITYSFGGREDEKIDKTKDKHSEIVRYKAETPKHKILIDFKKYYQRKTFVNDDGEEVTKWKPITDAHLDKFKTEMHEKYNINKDSIVTLEELANSPKADKRYYNVIVAPGESDDAAVRRDVLGIYLLYH